MTESEQIPAPPEFFLTTSIYHEFEWDGEDVWRIVNLRYFKGVIDCYCPGCHKNATFQGIAPEIPPQHIRNYEQENRRRNAGYEVSYPDFDAGIFVVYLQCTRSNAHMHSYVFLVRKRRYVESGQLVKINTIQKIGQYPSFADLNIAKIKSYSSVLASENLREFSRAVGLASHDIGVGSYVYLRRIFESLVEEAHQEALKSGSICEETYQKSRMAEKIKLLKGFLPEFLSENLEIYSILSKGIHLLTEKECLDHFEVLKVSIELILDERLEQKEKEKKISSAQKSLQKTKLAIATTKNE